MFMEKYGFKLLWYSLLFFVFVVIPGGILYSMHFLGHFTYGEAGFFVGLLIIVSLVAIFVGKFMGNVFDGLFTGLYNGRSRHSDKNEEKKL